MATKYRIKNPRPGVFHPQYKSELGLWLTFTCTYHSYAGSSTERESFETLEDADSYICHHVARLKRNVEHKAMLKREYPKLFRWPRLNIEKMG